MTGIETRPPTSPASPPHSIERRKWRRRPSGLRIQWIGLNEQSHPYAVQECIDGTQDESVNNVADQRTE